MLHSASSSRENILSYLDAYCPRIKVQAIADSEEKALDLLGSKEFELVFYGLERQEHVKSDKTFLSNLEERGLETILVSPQNFSPSDCQNESIAGIIREPLDPADFIVVVNNVLQKLELKQELSEANGSSVDRWKKSTKDMIGIPTMEGFEYLKIDSIVRCEGLQKCTRIVTENRSDIISSYPIGAFKHLLAESGFYDIHRSHLVNVSKIERYTRDGFLWLSDESQVPLARRRRTDFFSIWRQI